MKDKDMPLKLNDETIPLPVPTVDELEKILTLAVSYGVSAMQYGGVFFELRSLEAQAPISSENQEKIKEALKVSDEEILMSGPYVGLNI